jgi:hypothetical protein
MRDYPTLLLRHKFKQRYSTFIAVLHFSHSRVFNNLERALWTSLGHSLLTMRLILHLGAVVVIGFKTTYIMQSVPITINVVSTNLIQAIQHYVIKFVSDLRQVDGFLRVLQFPPPIKTDHHDITKILLKVVLKTINYKPTYNPPNVFNFRHLPFREEVYLIYSKAKV